MTKTKTTKNIEADVAELEANQIYKFQLTEHQLDDLLDKREKLIDELCSLEAIVHANGD